MGKFCSQNDFLVIRTEKYNFHRKNPRKTKQKILKFQFEIKMWIVFQLLQSAL